jgi:hypothetical protein
MLKFIEKIQYSLIYLLYKGKYFKSGKGYFYRANHMISIPVAFIVTINIKVFSKIRLSNNYAALLFLIVAISIFYLLECNIRKRKLYIHRSTFLKKDFYLKIYFAAMSLAVLATGVLWGNVASL